MADSDKFETYVVGICTLTIFQVANMCKFVVATVLMEKWKAPVVLEQMPGANKWSPAVVQAQSTR